MSVHAVQRVFQTLDDIVSMKDASAYLGKHHLRVSAIAGQIAIAMGLPYKLCEIIHRASSCHDIGKIGVENKILYKATTLSNLEWEKMKMHPVIGAELLSNRLDNKLKLLGFDEVIKAIRCHHERWDGLGYPDGLTGYEIPLAARIIAVADSYEAMTSNRPYRKGLQKDEAIKEIIRCTGSQFDPEVVSFFLQIEHLL